VSIFSSITRAGLVAAFAVAVLPTASAQSQTHIKSLIFLNAQQPEIRIDMTHPIVYRADGSVELTCVPLASDPRKCFELNSTDSRAPIVALSSNRPFVAGSQDIYQATSGLTFSVFRSITNSADICVPGVEGVATVSGWASTASTSSSSTVSIAVNVPQGQSRDITLTLRCYNQWGSASQPTRRVFRVFR